MSVGELPLPERRASLDALATYRRLLERRRDRVCEALAAQQSVWQEAQQRCRQRTTERALLQADVDALRRWQQRDRTAITAEQLQSAARRAHWLAYDIEKADYYLDMARDDAMEADRERQRLLREYRLAEERIGLVESSRDRLGRRLAARVEDANGEYR